MPCEQLPHAPLAIASLPRWAVSSRSMDQNKLSFLKLLCHAACHSNNKTSTVTIPPLTLVSPGKLGTQPGAWYAGTRIKTGHALISKDTAREHREGSVKDSSPQTQSVFGLIPCLAHPLPSLPLRLIHQRGTCEGQARCGYSVPE